jgi:hypothetical protein
MGHEDNKQSKGTNWWFFRGITDASITLSEDLPAIAKPFVRILALAILSILTVLMIPWFIFRRFSRLNMRRILLLKPGQS